MPSTNCVTPKPKIEAYLCVKNLQDRIYTGENGDGQKTIPHRAAFEG